MWKSQYFIQNANLLGDVDLKDVIKLKCGPSGAALIQ